MITWTILKTVMDIESEISLLKVIILTNLFCILLILSALHPHNSRPYAIVYMWQYRAQ